MTKKRKTGLVIGAAAACIAVLCAAGACNVLSNEEKAVRPAVTTSTTAITTSIAPPTTTAPVTITADITADTTATQITTFVTCSTAEQEPDKMQTPTTTTEQTTATDTTVQPTTTMTPVTTTAPAPAESYHGQTSGDYIYVNGFGWIFNEGGGGEGSLNYEMYCNGNKIGYFG